MAATFGQFPANFRFSAALLMILMILMIMPTWMILTILTILPIQLILPILKSLKIWPSWQVKQYGYSRQLKNHIQKEKNNWRYYSAMVFCAIDYSDVPLVEEGHR